MSHKTIEVGAKQMEVKPKISVITGSKNGGRFLRSSLNSVLQQSFTNYEHIIADGASTDDTLDILREYEHNGYNIRWISELDNHSDEAFYKAMTMSHGDYIMFCCISDGYIDKDWFCKCVDILDNNPEVSLVYGLVQCMSEDGTLGKIMSSGFLDQLPPQKEAFFPFWLGTFILFPESTFCVRADVFKECFPRYKQSDSFLQNHALLSFNYNFNSKGYLPYFLPVVASYGRTHCDMKGIELAEEVGFMKKQYQLATVQYGNEVLSGTKKHVFREGNSNVIRVISGNELKSYRKKVLDYRINRRTYLGKRKKRSLSHQLNKLKILIDHYLKKNY